MKVTKPTLHDILGLLHQLAPLELAEPWDNPGLQVGDPLQRIARICIALDPCLESLRESVRQGAQLLLTHHPLIFKPLNRLDLRSYPANVVAEAVREGISIVAAHTNLDMAQMGINEILAEQLELQEVNVLKKTEAGAACGLGRIGLLPRMIPFSSFVEKAKEIFGAERIRFTGKLEKEIRRVAVVGGSGGSLIRDAFEAGADLLVTGDVGHHDAMEARILGLAVIDGGHFLTERLGMRKFTAFFQDRLKNCQWDVEVFFLEDETDPLTWA